jgi:pre-60S factor REI1
MRSDWHRYNLKRRVASLPPISSEIFTDKVLSAQANNSAAATKAAFERICTNCQKTYYSENAYQAHLGSKKHKLRILTAAKGAPAGDEPTNGSAVLGEPAEHVPPVETRDPEAEAEFDKVVDGLKGASIEDGDPLPRRPSRPHHSALEQKEAHPLSPEPSAATATGSDESRVERTEVPLSRCLFCNYDSPTWKLNTDHMAKIHGLFIPEQNYLTDLEGLLRYLQDKVHENHECLLCHKLKGTTSGVQTHMRDKGHCRIAFETEEEMVEIGQFYDFSSTYSDAESEMEMEQATDPVTNGGVKLPGEKSENAEDDGWETDSSFSSLDSAELTSVPVDDHSHQYSKLSLHRHHSHHDPRPHRNADGFHSHAHHGPNAVFHDEFELHLPSGRTAGHRNFKKYFRQNLHNYPTPAERYEKAQRLLEQDEGEDQEMADASTLPLNNGQSQSLLRRSEAGMLGVTDEQKREVRASEIRGRRQGENAQNRYQAKLEKQNNFQKHFRVSRSCLLHASVSANMSPLGPVTTVIFTSLCWVSVWDGTSQCKGRYMLLARCNGGFHLQGKYHWTKPSIHKLILIDCVE